MKVNHYAWLVKICPFDYLNRGISRFIVESLRATFSIAAEVDVVFRLFLNLFRQAGNFLSGIVPGPQLEILQVTGAD